jgi:hypothetical protein
VLAYIVRRWPFSRSKSALLVLSSSLPANVRSSPKVTALLGDANFPTSAVSHYKDGRQLLIQDLYERYSGLAFTMPADRSIAILGLQERLSRAFNTKAAHGLFDAYFARGLLWKRRHWQRLERIVQPPGRRVPSWSSLSKHGSIQYMDATNELRFENVSWATDDFRNPFITRKEPVKDNDIVAFSGRARKMMVSKLDMLTNVTFDGDEEFEVDNLRCVVIGRDKDNGAEVSSKNHVLVIHQSHDSLGLSWQRVGVASLDRIVLEEDGIWVDIY